MFSVTKNKIWLLLLPVVLIIAGIIGLVAGGGFKEDIDFAGGTSMQIKISRNLSGAERDELASIYAEAAGIDIKPIVQTTGQAFDEVVVKSTSLNEEQRSAAFEAVKNQYGLSDDAQFSTNNQSPSYGNEMKRNTLLFSLIAAVLMLIYITIRFEWRSGIMAVAALVINILVMLSVYALFGIPLSTTFIAAILTVMGYSINDTIIIFDRIRENTKLAKKESYTEIAEKSIWQTMARTINTSVTTLITIVLLYFLGATAIKDFAFPIIVGIICGSYTSIFVASPWWAAWKDANKKAVAPAGGKKKK